MGSLLIVFVALLALPIGLARRSTSRSTRRTPADPLHRTNIRNLAGVPAVVYGLLGLAVFVTAAGHRARPSSPAGLTLAIVVLPIVIITAAEALRAVPSRSGRRLRCGATRWEAVRSHVLPYAAPGILTGTDPGPGARLRRDRAAADGGRRRRHVLRGRRPREELAAAYTALPTIIFDWARKPQEEFRALTAAAIVVLLVVILLVNAIAILLRNRYDRRW